MVATRVYLIILSILTIYTFGRKSNVLGKLLFCMYTAAAIFSVISVNSGIIASSNVTLIPYLYLIICYVIFFSPFTKKDTVCNAEKLVTVVDGKLKFIAIVYIVCALVSISCYLPSVLKLFADGSWATNRVNLYRDELTAPYSNIFQYYAMQFAGYFRILALVIGFGLLRKAKQDYSNQNKEKKVEKIIGWLTLASAIASIAISSMYSSSRGTIVNVFIFVMAVYLFFYYEIETNKRRLFAIMAILAVAVIAPYIIEVTVSRFTSGGASDSVVSYLGQPPIVFNKSIFYLPKHAWGNFGIGILWDAPFSEASIGGNWNTGFYTFVGWLYIDWGVLGVILIGCAVALLVGKIVNKEQYKISDVFLILTYYQTLTNGVFVIGRSYIYNIVGSIIIYLILRLFIEEKVYVLGNVKF